MELSDAVPILAVLVGVVILANAAERRRELRPLLVISWLLINLIFVLLAGFLQPHATPLTLILTLLFSGAASLLLIDAVRRRIAGWFPQRTAENGNVGFDPDSPLQSTALILCLYLVANTVISFALAGGLGGVAQEMESRAGGVISAGSLLLQMSVFLLFAFAGAGLGVRRSLTETLARLGLRAPTLSELAIGGAVAFGLFGVVFGVSVLWQVLTPPDVIERQTQVSGLIASSITTLTLAFLVAFTAAVGEEIAFRGALQPVFGILPTTVVFALAHLQYTLTPATVVIVVVSVALGLLRKRYNTSIAIFAHFVYNFVPLAFVLVLLYLKDSGGLR